MTKIHFFQSNYPDTFNTTQANDPSPFNPASSTATNKTARNNARLFPAKLLSTSLWQKKPAAPIRLSLNFSRTSQVFHIVDQLAEWSPYCHTAYNALLDRLDARTEQSQRLLEKHKALRRKYDWGQGLEKTFYSTDTIENAAQAGISAGSITAEEAAEEIEILNHFADVFKTWLDNENSKIKNSDLIEVFDHEIAKNKNIIEALAEFTKASRHKVYKVILVPAPDPHNFGGGNNGGGSVLEVPPDTNVFPTAIHEIFHEMTDPWKKQMEELIQSQNLQDRISSEDLNEALAYAIAPGLIGKDPSKNDTLETSKTQWKTSHSKTHRRQAYADEIRPLLASALLNQPPMLDFLSDALTAIARIEPHYR